MRTHHWWDLPLIAMGALLGCPEEVEGPPPASSGETAGGAGSQPTDCDGCRYVSSLIGLHGASYFQACPGVFEKVEEKRACMCDQCGDICTDCVGENVEDVPACQACWTEAGTGPCNSVVQACFADQRISSSHAR